MGNIDSAVKNLNISNNFLFLRGFLTDKKINLLKLVNSDYIIEEEIFCNFFLTDSIQFKNLDTKENGLISMFDLFMIIYLLKEDYLDTKIKSIYLI